MNYLYLNLVEQLLCLLRINLKIKSKKNYINLKFKKCHSMTNSLKITN